MPDAKSAIESADGVDRLARVQENFHDPRDHNEDENENVVAFQPAPDGFEFADLERRQDQIFADQFLPFALQEVPVFHDHGDEEMRLEHAHPRAKSVVEPVTPRLDPEHDPDDREIEKENEMRNAGVGKSDRDDGRAARDRPVRRRVEPGAPDHDAAEFAAVKMRHRIDVALVIQAGAVCDDATLRRSVADFQSPRVANDSTLGAAHVNLSIHNT